jgi:hypothetical protein
MIRPPRRDVSAADAGYRKHPTGGLYRYVIEDGHRVPEWADPPKCTGKDGTHTETCFACRVYIPTVPDWRQL